LRTLAVDVGLLDAMARLLPAEVCAVAESGLKTAGDLQRLLQAGYQAFLIGERFMVADDPGAALADVLARARQVPA
jgi:indole-3-glycerol phosphate synthase